MCLSNPLLSENDLSGQSGHFHLSHSFYVLPPRRAPVEESLSRTPYISIYPLPGPSIKTSLPLFIKSSCTSSVPLEMRPLPSVHIQARSLNSVSPRVASVVGLCENATNSLRRCHKCLHPESSVAKLRFVLVSESC